MDHRTYFLIGHAYDPFKMLSAENEILREISINKDVWEATNTLTGVFCFGYIEDGKIVFTTDAAGQQLVYYGVINGTVYITSHSQMVADLCGLQQDPYVSELTGYRFYHLFGLVLPGDLSPYRALKRAQCNFFTTISCEWKISIQRFWPKSAIQTCDSEKQYQDTVRQIADILHKNLELVSQKWPDGRAAISVTGGMDSKTTMACCNGLYDRFSYFSYDSLPDERVDAEAAHKMCAALGLRHQIYRIPEQMPVYEPISIWQEIFSFNSGNIGKNHLSDVKKRLFFTQISDFDVEVKSWVDEIGRARYHKRFGKNSFPSKPTPRYLTSLYKAFLHNRSLVRKTDTVFEAYLNTYFNDGVFDKIPWWDLVYWEFEWNAAEGLFLTGEHLFSYDITIPFNNRALLERMLSVPLQKRIDDQIQKDVIAYMNPKIVQTGIHVNDVSHTKKRAAMERIYLEIHSRLPF